MPLLDLETVVPSQVREGLRTDQFLRAMNWNRTEFSNLGPDPGALLQKRLLKNLSWPCFTASSSPGNPVFIDFLCGRQNGLSGLLRVFQQSLKDRCHTLIPQVLRDTNLQISSHDVKTSRSPDVADHLDAQTQDLL